MKQYMINLQQDIVFDDVASENCMAPIAVISRHNKTICVNPTYRDEAPKLQAFHPDYFVFLGDSFRIDTWDNAISQHGDHPDESYWRKKS